MRQARSGLSRLRAGAVFAWSVRRPVIDNSFKLVQAYDKSALIASSEEVHTEYVFQAGASPSHTLLTFLSSFLLHACHSFTNATYLKLLDR